MKLKHLILLTLLLSVFSIGSGHASIAVDSLGPKVFLLGDDEDMMNTLNKNYPNLLMKVCQNDMDVAYDKWMNMLAEMEVYAIKLDYDIKGIKLWMNVYWNKNGKIDYIGYYLKPNSRNIKTEELNAFFINFIKNYQMNLTYSGKFYHNGSAAFPTHYQFLKDQEAKEK